MKKENMKHTRAGDIWYSHRDRVYSDDNVTPMLNRRLNDVACMKSFIPSYSESRRIIRAYKNSSEDLDASQQSIINSIDKNLTDSIKYFEERSKDCFYGSFIDLKHLGLIESSDQEEKVIKLQQTLSNVQIASQFGVSESMISKTEKKIRKKVNESLLLMNYPVLWFFDEMQRNIILAYHDDTSKSSVELATELNILRDTLEEEWDHISYLIHILDPLIEKKELMDSVVLNKLGTVNRRLIYILSESDYSNKEISKIMDKSVSYVKKEKSYIKNRFLKGYQIGSEIRGVCAAQ